MYKIIFFNGLMILFICFCIIKAAERHPSTSESLVLSRDDRSSIGFSETDDEDELEFPFKSIGFEKSEMFYFQREGTIKLLFSALIEKQAPCLTEEKNGEKIKGAISIKKKKIKGYQKEGDKLCEGVYLLINFDEIIFSESNPTLVYASACMVDKGLTNYYRVPMILNPTNKDQYNELAIINNYDDKKVLNLFFDFLFKNMINEASDSEFMDSKAKMKKLSETDKTELINKFLEGGRTLVFFEKNEELLPDTCKSLFSRLNLLHTLNVDSLLQYFDANIKNVKKNRFNSLNGAIGKNFAVNKLKTDKKKILEHAFIIDCYNLVQFVLKENASSDIYEIFDIFPVRNINLGIVLKFDFPGCTFLKKKNVRVTTNKGKDYKKFDFFPYYRSAYVVLVKIELFEDHVQSFTIKFKQGPNKYESAPISVQ